MAIISFTGFEMGEAALEATITGNAAVNESAPRSGKYALRVTAPSGDASHHARVEKGGNIVGFQTLNLTAAIVGFGFCIRSWGSTSVARTIFRLTTSADATILHVTYTPSTGKLAILDATGATIWTASANVPRVWHFVEVKYDRVGNTMSIWLDGVAVLSGGACAYSGRTLGRVYLGPQGDTAAVATVVDYDDVYISSDATPLGPRARVGVLWPVDAGDYAGWNGLAPAVRIPPDGGAGAWTATPGSVSFTVLRAAEARDPMQGGELKSLKVCVAQNVST